MKILLCHNFYQQTGGEDIAVGALKALLEEKGHKVILYAEDNHEIDGYGILDKIGFFPRSLFSVKSYRALRRIVNVEKPDIAHVHNVFPLLSPAIYTALNHCRVPTVQTVHNYRFMCINGLFLRKGQVCELCKRGNFYPSFRFKCYRDSYALSALYALTIGGHRHFGTFGRIDHFIALSRFAAEKLIESGVTRASNISVLENFLPLPLPEYGTPDLRKPYVCYIGRLSQEKGIFTLLDAMREVRTVGLKVMGTGPMAERIKDYISTHRLQSVEMLGFVEGEEKYRVLRGALCCVLPSECYENFPFAVLESAAVGTAVVASRIGSLASIISEDKTGSLFVPGNSRDLASKLTQFSENPDKAIRMGKSARSWIEERYTPDAHYDALMNIYAKAAGIYPDRPTGFAEQVEVVSGH